MRAAGVGSALGESSADVLRTSRSCSSARLEAKAIGVARGKRGDGHEVSILIRVGDGEAGRAPSTLTRFEKGAISR